MIQSINHVTLSVTDLSASLRFYVSVLGLRLAARGATWAYLEAGSDWLALTLDPATRRAPLDEETHTALSVSEMDFSCVAARVRASGAPSWRENSSEGLSHYFLDPDGHKLEIHVGTLGSRLAALQANAPEIEGPAGTGRADMGEAATVPTRHQAFPQGSLRCGDLLSDPVAQFHKWFEEAVDRGEVDPFAMTLATSGADAAPSARMVSLKGVADGRFVFTGSYGGLKGRDLQENPRAALVFYWPRSGRQVRVAGSVSRLSPIVSAAYFSARPRASQLAAAAFVPGCPVSDRRSLDNAVAALDRRCGDGAVPRPHWGAYALCPHRVEFWQGCSDRLHDRFQYDRAGDGPWRIQRITP